MTQHILIVEDELKLSSLLQDYLIQSGFEVTCLHDGADVQPWLAEHHTNLVLLDIMLPNKSGVDCANRPICWTLKSIALSDVIPRPAKSSAEICNAFSNTVQSRTMMSSAKNRT